MYSLFQTLNTLKHGVKLLKVAKTAETSLDREKRWRKESGGLNALSMVCVFQVFQWSYR